MLEVPGPTSSSRKLGYSSMKSQGLFNLSKIFLICSKRILLDHLVFLV